MYDFIKEQIGVTMATNIDDNPIYDYYDYCKLDNDGMLIFGDEQGCFGGGDYISPNYAINVIENKLYIYKDSDVPMELYYANVAERIKEIYKYDRPFYNNIIKMLTDNPKFPDKCKEWLDKIKDWVSAVAE